MNKRLLATLLSLVLALIAVPVIAIAETLGEDPNPPVFVSASIDKKVATVGDKITISYDITDPDGIRWISSTFVNTNPKDIVVRPDTPSDGGWSIMSSDGQQNQTTIEVLSKDAAGTRYLVGFEVTDNKGYVNNIWDKTYAEKTNKSGQTADLSDIYYTLEEPKPDPNPPVFVSASIDKKVATVGDKITISYDITDPDGIRWISSTFVNTNPKDIVVRPDTPSDGGWSIMSSDGQQNQTTIEVLSKDAAGTRYLVGFEVTDNKGYVNNIWDKTYAEKTNKSGQTADLSDIYYTLFDKANVPTYEVMNGANSTYSKDSDAGLEFRFDGLLENFSHLDIDDTTVPKDHYELKSGSTIVSISPNFLKTLDAGDHTIAAVYNDGGRATTTFTVQANGGKLDNTGDASNVSNIINSPSQNAQINSPSRGGNNVNALPKTGDDSFLMISLLLVASISLLVAGISLIKLGMRE